MTPSDFTDKQLQDALDQSEGAISKAAQLLGLKTISLRGACESRHLKWKKKDHCSTAYRAKHRVLTGLRDTLDKELARWPNVLREKREVAAKVLACRRPQKVLVFADLHVPFQATACVNEMLREDGDADWGVCVADFFNVDVVSHFRRMAPTDWDREWRDGCAIASTIREKMRMVWMEGNHELRLLKFLADVKLDPQMVAWLAERGGSLISTLVKSTRGKNTYAVGSPWMMLGDVFLGHMEDEHSSVVGRSATNCLDWAMWNVTETVRGAVQAHTHKQAWVRHHNRHAIECGCLCHQMDYVMESGRTGPSKKEPWQRGYVVLYFDREGRVEWKKTRMVPLDYNLEDAVGDSSS